MTTRIKVNFTRATAEGRQVCEAIETAEKSPLLKEALRLHIQWLVRVGIAELQKS